MSDLRCLLTRLVPLLCMPALTSCHPTPICGCGGEPPLPFDVAVTGKGEVSAPATWGLAAADAVRRCASRHIAVRDLAICVANRPDRGVIVMLGRLDPAAMPSEGAHPMRVDARFDYSVADMASLEGPRAGLSGGDAVGAPFSMSAPHSAAAAALEHLARDGGLSRQIVVRSVTQEAVGIAVMIEFCPFRPGGCSAVYLPSDGGPPWVMGGA